MLQLIRLGLLVFGVAAATAGAQTVATAQDEPPLPDAAATLEEARTGCAAGSWNRCTLLGDLLTRSDHEEALEAYRKACEHGVPASCNNAAALLTLTTYGSLPLDFDAAHGLFQKACDGGDETGCYNLGVDFCSGRGVAKDTVKALALFEKALQADNLSVSVLVARQLMDGGCAPHSERARVLLGNACDGGSADACFLVAERFADVPEQRFELLQRACDGGSGAGCVLLARVSETGHGVAADESRAVDLYGRACDLGNAVGCYWLGRERLRAEGGGASFSEGIQLLARAEGLLPPGQTRAVIIEADAEVTDSATWTFATSPGQDLSRFLDRNKKRVPEAVDGWESACRQGVAESCYLLGYVHYGLGVKKDPAERVTQWERACDLGFTPGCLLAGQEYLLGSKQVPKDLARSATLYRAACDGGSEEACGRLAEALAKGKGIPRDEVRARHLEAKARTDGIGLSL